MDARGGSQNAVGAMVDHVARAKDLRIKAAKYRLWAKSAASPMFGGCYDLLADNYNILATLEEEFVSRQISSRMENKFQPQG